VAVSPTALKVIVLYPSLAEATGVRTPTGVLAATVQTNILICPAVPAASVYATVPVADKKEIGVVTSIAPLVNVAGVEASPKYEGTLLNTLSAVIFLFVGLEAGLSTT
jgi:hypothetical protein